eukprot:2850730-Pyramimonas_sp.AAC.1
MEIMGWLASISPETPRSAGSTEAGLSATSAAGAHFATLRGVTMAKFFARAETRAPGSRA